MAVGVTSGSLFIVQASHHYAQVISMGECFATLGGDQAVEKLHHAQVQQVGPTPAATRFGGACTVRMQAFNGPVL